MNSSLTLEITGRETRSSRRSAAAAFRDLVLPREHGSWSLALEPLAFGLLVAPSLPGLLFALAVIAAFFARRPLNLAVRESRPARRSAARHAAFVCVGIAAVFFGLTLVSAGAAWTIWLLPSLLAGGIFLGFDLRGLGRAQIAEVAGAAAFAFLPAALAALAGKTGVVAVVPGMLMLFRAIPTVLVVRSVLRGAKAGDYRPTLPIAATIVAAGFVTMLAIERFTSWVLAGLLGMLALRAVVLLGFPRPALRARTIGMIEAMGGVVFVSIGALAARG